MLLGRKALGLEILDPECWCSCPSRGYNESCDCKIVNAKSASTRIHQVNTLVTRTCVNGTSRQQKTMKFLCLKNKTPHGMNFVNGSSTVRELFVHIPYRAS